LAAYQLSAGGSIISISLILAAWRHQRQRNVSYHQLAAASAALAANGVSSAGGGSSAASAGINQRGVSCGGSLSLA